MATSAYRTWVRAGRPWRLAQPIADIEAWAKRTGVKILGTIGNDEHLTSNRPQDHTPFSATAWPVRLSGYIVTAIDLDNKDGLGQRIEDLARAGRLPWLKYMNHSGRHLDSRDLDGDGTTWEEYPSSDEHVHLSIRSDWHDRPVGENPFGSNGGGDDMGDLDYIDGWKRPEKVGNRPAAVTLAEVWTNEQFGVGPYGGKSYRTQQLDRIEAKVSAPGSIPVALTEADLAAIVAGLAAELRPAIEALRAGIDADTRDTVGDFGRGGVAAVEADAG